MDLNFAQTKRLDPRITYSRASSGTYFDSTGLLKSATTNQARFDHDPTTGESLGLLVEEARTNLVTYSEKFDKWATSYVSVTANGISAPDGTTTADTVAADGTLNAHWIYGVDSTTGPKTFSVFAKAATNNFIQLLFAGDGVPYANFDLSAGVVGSIGSDSIASIQPLPNGWYRCSLSTSSTTATSPYLGIISSATAFRAEANTLPPSVYLWGAQTEAGSFPTSYIPTPATFTSRASTATYYDSSGVIQTAGVDVARDNAYLPDENGVMRPAGLLLEAAGTNRHTYSEQFDNAAWTKYGATITANTTTAPDGTITADKLASTSGAALIAVQQVDTTLTNGASYTRSVFAKASEISSLTLQIGNTSTGNVFVQADLLAGTATNGGAVVGLANGWFRISYSYTQSGTTGDFYLRLPDNTVAGSGVFIWGAQLEASSFPTSYIPTAGSTVTRAADVSSSSTVTRSADVAQITGSNFSSWFNPDSSSIFTEYKTNQSGWYVPLYSLNDNGNSNAFWLQGYNSNSWNPYLTGLGNGYISSTGGGPFSGNNKVAISLETGSFKMAENGAMNTGVASSNITGPFTAVTRLRFAVSVATGNVSRSITFARLTYYPVRLSDATLQTLTS